MEAEGGHSRSLRMGNHLAFICKLRMAIQELLKPRMAIHDHDNVCVCVHIHICIHIHVIVRIHKRYVS